jgi:hypothetical protein
MKWAPAEGGAPAAGLAMLAKSKMARALDCNEISRSFVVYMHDTEQKSEVGGRWSEVGKDSYR